MSKANNNMWKFQPKQTLPVLLFGLALLVGCDRQGTVLSKGAPPNPLVAKKVPVVPGQNLDKLALLRKSSNLSAAHLVKALGGFQYKAQSHYTLTRGKQVVELKETYTLKQHSSGSFQAQVSNSEKKGYTVIWNGKTLFWRDRFRPYRKVSENIERARRWQQRGYGRWRAIVSIFGERLSVALDGSSSTAGRSCLKYNISLRDKALTAAKIPMGTVWQGKLPQLTRGKAANMKRTPTSAKGHFCVTKTGLVLSAHFDGSYTLGNNAATMKMKLRAGMTSFGNPTISIPTKLADIKREPVPLDPFALKKNKPFYFQPPPTPDDKKKKKKRR